MILVMKHILKDKLKLMENKDDILFLISTGGGNLESGASTF